MGNILWNKNFENLAYREELNQITRFYGDRLQIFYFFSEEKNYNPFFLGRLDEKKLNLIPEYKTGGLSIKWENFNKINLNDIDILSSINDGNESIINELVEKVKLYITDNKIIYNEILIKMQ